MLSLRVAQEDDSGESFKSGTYLGYQDTQFGGKRTTVYCKLRFISLGGGSGFITGSGSDEVC